MICEICGSSYTYSCPHCTRRIKTWGQEGVLFLMELAKSEDDIQSTDLVNIINTYYMGKATVMSDKANVLRTALRFLGYKGNFIGRIHKNGETYVQIRRREQGTAKRHGLKNTSCDMCGSSETLMIHHIVPLSWGGVSSEENCITLCKTCHLAVHKRIAKLLNRERLLIYLAPHSEEIESLARQSIDL
jgi:hypothetical protein